MSSVKPQPRAPMPIREFQGEITDLTPVMGDAWLLTFTAPPEVIDNVRSGQFVNVLPHDTNVYDPFLRRPFSVFGVSPSEATMTLLVRPYGRGGNWIIERGIGEPLNALGLLGNSFEVAPRSTHLLLIAGGVGTAPLRLLAHEAVAQGKEVVFLLGARTADQLLDAKWLPSQVEYVIATEDASAGHTGFVTDLVKDYLTWSDQVFTCGPTPMFYAVRDQVMRHRIGKTPTVQVSVERTMACGVGACLGCVIETKQGMKASCVDGPVFDMDSVVW